MRSAPTPWGSSSLRRSAARSLSLLRDLQDLDVLKVAVVVTEGERDGRRLDPEVKELLGRASSTPCSSTATRRQMSAPPSRSPTTRRCACGASRRRGHAGYRSPRVLADAWSANAAGGTGQQIPAASRRRGAPAPCGWPAGSAPRTWARSSRLSPELVDASSGLEESPGRKDRRNSNGTSGRYEHAHV